MKTKTNKYFLYIGVIWTGLFAGASFYWAMGGMMGVKSLGGAIYEQALNPEPPFVMIVWVTGFVKILGVVLLVFLRFNWKSSWIRSLLYFTTKLFGMFIFLYGLLNFITITLSTVGILDFELDSYATFWRLLFWEPYWMIGGILYWMSVQKM